eukprot:3145576-Amphidinium_carterae.1
MTKDRADNYSSYGTPFQTAARAATAIFICEGVAEDTPPQRKTYRTMRKDQSSIVEQQVKH